MKWAAQRLRSVRRFVVVCALVMPVVDVFRDGGPTLVKIATSLITIVLAPIVGVACYVFVGASLSWWEIPGYERYKRLYDDFSYLAFGLLTFLFAFLFMLWVFPIGDRPIAAGPIAVLLLLYAQAHHYRNEILDPKEDPANRS